MTTLEKFILKRHKIIIIVLVIVFILIFISFIFVIAYKDKLREVIGVPQSNSDNTQVSDNNPFIPTVSIVIDSSKGEKELVIGNRLPGTTEAIDIIANKKTERDNIALIRLRVEGGVINDVTSKYINLGSCSNFKKILDNNICADIAKTDPFIEGEVIATITIKWQDGQSGHIFRSAADGMYNGIDFNASN